MIDFLILYEHKQREYDSVRLLKFLLEKKGYSVNIEKTAQLSYIKYLFKKNKPKVIITYSMYNDDSIVSLVLSVCWKIKKIVNLQWEQVFSNNPESISSHTPSEYAKNAVHICWGKECQNRLLINNIKNAFITGAIHLDFLRTKFNSFHMTKNELLNKYNLPKGKMILYISSFTQVGLTEREYNILEKTMGNGYIDFLKNNLKTRVITLEWLDELLEMDSENYIIYRPHPGENLDNELEKRIKKGRFFVVRDLSVKEWILSADQIYTWFSTAIVEAFFANKNCGILRPFPIEQLYDIQLYKNANIISDNNQLLSYYKSQLKRFPITKETINNYYDISEKYSYERIIELLESVYSSKKYDINHFPCMLYVKAIKTIIIRFIKKLIVKFNITSKTFVIKNIPKISQWLDFFYHYQNKERMEIVSKEEDLEIVKRLERIF